MDGQYLAMTVQFTFGRYFSSDVNHEIQDNNGELSKEEFLEGARQDKTIVQALSLYDGMV